MLTTVLIPLDGSPLAERALDSGEWLARSSGARLVLVRVADQTHPASDEAQAYLDTLAATLQERGLSVEASVAFGEPAGAIVAVARACQADLIILTSHGGSGLGRSPYGGVTQAVLARSAVPVLVVRAWQDRGLAWPPADRPRRLLVPLDGSSFAEEALPMAERMASVLDAEIILLRVVQPPEHALATPGGRVIAYVDYRRTIAYQPGEEEHLRAEAQTRLAEDMAEAEGYLATVASGLRQSVGQVRAEVRVGPPVDGITTVGSQEQAALVVMATHGRTGLGRLLVGSVAEAVLRLGMAPLLLVRPLAFRRMLAALTAHSAAEERSLAAYRSLAETVGDPMVALLLRLVVEDEERHHRVLERMEASLRDSLQWSRSSEALPTGPVRPTAAQDGAIEALRAFMEEERQGAHQMREVAHQDPQLHEGLFALLLETMAMDSDKHARMLRFALDRLESLRPAG